MLYLAIQIRGQRKEQKQQSLQLMWTAWNETGRSLVDVPEVAALVTKGSSSYEELDATEQLRFGTFYARWLKSIEPIYYLYLDEILDTDAWETTRNNMRSMTRTRGFGEFWSQGGAKFFRPEFRRLVEEIASESRSSAR